MQAIYKAASVIGRSSSTEWGQSLVLPEALVLAEVSDNDGIARPHGMRILSEVTRKVADKPKSLKELNEIIEKIFDAGVVSLVIAVPVGDTLYLVSKGEGLVILRRNQRYSELINGEGSVSGKIQAGDMLVLTTRGIAKSSPTKSIVDLFDHLSASEISERLTLMLHQMHDAEPPGAALIVEIKGFTEDDAIDDDQKEAFNTPGKRIFIPISKDRIFNIARQLKRGRMPGAWRIKVMLRKLFKTSKTKRLILVIFLIAAFGFSIFLGVRRQSQMKAGDGYLAYIDLAKRSYGEGVSLSDLNAIKSREKLKEALDAVSQAKTIVKPKTKEGREAASLYEEISGAYQESKKEYIVTPELFFDASLLKKDAKTTNIARFEETLGILDSLGNTVFAVNIETKNGQTVGGGDIISGTRSIGMHGTNLYTVGKSGVYKFPISGSFSKDPIIKPDSEWGTIGDMVAFAGNLYLLDTGKGRIWKYVATEKGFSERREYLNPDTLPDLSKSTNIAIDGSVWLGTTDGKILKFQQGKEAAFVFQGVEPSLSGTLYPYVSDDTQALYVLDPKNKRVVVLDKQGTYLSQYVWDKEILPVALNVNENSKKVLLLANNLIYSFDLK